MTRRLSLIVAASLTAVVLLTGCSRTVRVETGERITCSYGEVVTDTVKSVEVAAGKAGDYRVVRTTVTCDRHKLLEKTYAEAQAAIIAGDLVTARAKLLEVVTLEPLFASARQQLDAIDAGEKPTPDASVKTPTTTTPSSPAATSTAKPDSGQVPVGPVASLSGWVPDALPGYSATPIIADVYVLTREYLPSKSAPTDALVAVVEQYKDATSAKLAIKNELRRSYPSGGSTLTIEGRSVYFGTDGQRRAIVAWNEGGIVIAIEGAAADGSPAGLKSHLSGLVAAIVK